MTRLYMDLNIMTKFDNDTVVVVVVEMLLFLVRLCHPPRYYYSYSSSGLRMGRVRWLLPPVVLARLLR